MICILYTNARYSSDAWRDVCAGRKVPEDLFYIEYLEKLPKRQPENKSITLWIDARCLRLCGESGRQLQKEIFLENEIFWDIAAASLKQFSLRRSLGWR